MDLLWGFNHSMCLLKTDDRMDSLISILANDTKIGSSVSCSDEGIRPHMKFWSRIVRLDFNIGKSEVIHFKSK